MTHETSHFREWYSTQICEIAFGSRSVRLEKDRE